MGRRIDVEANDVAQLAANCGAWGRLNGRMRCGCKPWLRQMRRTELTLMPLRAALALGATIAAAVRCMVLPGGLLSVYATTRSTTARTRNGLCERWILSRSRPSGSGLHCRRDRPKARRSGRLCRPPRRWVIERCIARLGRNRRLARAFEATIASATAFLCAASLMILARRLARSS
jgi:hypothetical protein